MDPNFKNYKFYRSTIIKKYYIYMNIRLRKYVIYNFLFEYIKKDHAQLRWTRSFFAQGESLKQLIKLEYRSCYLTASTNRLFNGCTGRALLPTTLANCFTCDLDTSTGDFITNHFTPSLQGGVVSEPLKWL